MDLCAKSEARTPSYPQHRPKAGTVDTSEEDGSIRQKTSSPPGLYGQVQLLPPQR